MRLAATLMFAAAASAACGVAHAAYEVKGDAIPASLTGVPGDPVRLGVAASEVGVSEWQFWVDDGHLDPRLQDGDIR